MLVFAAALARRPPWRPGWRPGAAAGISATAKRFVAGRGASCASSPARRGRAARARARADVRSIGRSSSRGPRSCASRAPSAPPSGASSASPTWSTRSRTIATGRWPPDTLLGDLWGLGDSATGPRRERAQRVEHHARRGPADRRRRHRRGPDPPRSRREPLEQPGRVHGNALDDDANGSGRRRPRRPTSWTAPVVPDGRPGRLQLPRHARGRHGGSPGRQRARRGRRCARRQHHGRPRARRRRRRPERGHRRRDRVRRARARV